MSIAGGARANAGQRCVARTVKTAARAKPMIGDV